MTAVIEDCYWENWDVDAASNEKAFPPPEAPSIIRAVLTAHNLDGSISMEKPSIILVCEEGQVVALSPGDNWRTIEWQCEVAPPKPVGDNWEIFHAAYDYVTDDIYFSFSRPFILRGNKRQLMTSLATTKELDKFIAIEWAIFGIATDPKRRLLFACEQYANVVSIWQVGSDGKATQAASITSVSVPRFVAASTNGDDENAIARIAVSRTTWPFHDVIVLQAKLGQFNKHIARKDNIISGLLKRDNKINDIFSAIQIARRDSSGDLLSSSNQGGIKCPWDVVFDPVGNLFVADEGNKRIQIFAAGGTKAVWASRGAKNAYRLAVIAKHPSTGKPAALVSKGVAMDWFC